MTDTEPLRLLRDPDSSRELRWALSELPDERPNDEALGELRLRLSSLVGEPARLSRDSSQLGASVRDFEVAEPSAAELAALRKSLPQSPAASRAGKRARRAGRAAAMVWVWPLAAAAAAALGTGYFLYERARVHHPEPVPDAAPSASVLPAPPAAAASAIPVTSASAAESAGTSPSASAAAAIAKPSELSLLREAQKAVRSDPGKALALANRHARLYPGGLLAQEREVVAIQALASLGRAAEARARATRFQAAYPGSAYWPRIQHLLAGDAP